MNYVAWESKLIDEDIIAHNSFNTWSIFKNWKPQICHLTSLNKIFLNCKTDHTCIKSLFMSGLGFYMAMQIKGTVYFFGCDYVNKWMKNILN